MKEMVYLISLSTKRILTLNQISKKSVDGDIERCYIYKVAF